MVIYARLRSEESTARDVQEGEHKYQNTRSSARGARYSKTIPETARYCRCVSYTHRYITPVLPATAGARYEVTRDAAPRAKNITDYRDIIPVRLILNISLSSARCCFIIRRIPINICIILSSSSSHCENARSSARSIYLPPLICITRRQHL